MDIVKKFEKDILLSDIDPVQRLCFRLAGKSLGLLGLRTNFNYNSDARKNELLILDCMRSLLICSSLMNSRDPQLSAFASDYRSLLKSHLSLNRLLIAYRASIDSALQFEKSKRPEILRRCAQSVRDNSINLIDLFSGIDSSLEWSKRAVLKDEMVRNLQKFTEDDISSVIYATRRSGRRASLPPALSTKDPLYKAWVITKENLISRSDTWRVWIDWYEYRFLGLTSEDVPNSLWKPIELELCRSAQFLQTRDKVEANGIFAEQIIEQIEDLVDHQTENQLSQVAPKIKVDDDRITIEISSDAGSEEQNHSAFNELRIALADLTKEIKKNSASFLKDDVERYSSSFSALGWDDPIPFVVRGATLRKTLHAVEGRSYSSDLPELSDQTVLVLQNVVRTHNMVVMLHPKTRQIDEHLREGIKGDFYDPLEAFRSISELFRSKELLDEKSRQILDFTEAQLETDNAKDAARLIAFGFVGNFVQSASTWIWKNRGKFAAGVTVGGMTYSLGQWMIANEIWLLQTFPMNSGIGALLRRVLEILKDLPML